MALLVLDAGLVVLNAKLFLVNDKLVSISNDIGLTKSGLAVNLFFDQNNETQIYLENYRFHT